MRPMKHLKKALTTKKVEARYGTATSVIPITISNHARERFLSRTEFLMNELRLTCSRDELEEFESVYHEFIGYYFDYNLASLFNLAKLFELNEKTTTYNSRFTNYVDTKVFRAGNFDFIVEDRIVKTVELNGQYRHLNRPRKSYV